MYLQAIAFKPIDARRRPTGRVAEALCALLVLAAPAAVAQESPKPADPAAVVEIDTGDRISGSIVRMADGKLVVATDWAGEIELDWQRVVSVSSREPLHLVLTDATTLGGAATTVGSVLEVTAEATVRTVQLADIAAINPQEVPAVMWSGSASAALVATSGNTDTETAFVEGRADAETERNRFGFGASFKETSDDGETTSSRTSAFFAWERDLSERLYLDIAGTLTEDEFQDLDLRSTLAVSAGYTVFDREATQLSTEIGLSWVDESFIVALDDDYLAGRWAVDLNHRLRADGGIEVFHGHELLVGLEDSDDQLLRTRSGLRFQLVKKLVAALQYDLQWDKSPPPGAVSTDRALLLNLGLKW